LYHYYNVLCIIIIILLGKERGHVILICNLNELGKGNFTEKLNQFPRLISHVQARIYNTRRISCVYNYEATCR